jgi:hypothetical protein
MLLERRAENRRAGPSVTYIVAKREGFKGAKERGGKVPPH